MSTEEKIEEVQAEVVDMPAENNNFTAFTEKEKNTFAALKIKGQMADLEKLQRDIKNKQTEFSQVKNPDEDIDFIDAKLSSMTLEEIEKLSDEEVNAIFTDEDGNVTLEIGDDEKENIKFRRDYMIFRYESNKAIKEIDEEIEKFKHDCEEYEDEMKDALRGFDDMTAYLKDTLKKRKEIATSEDAKKRYDDMILMIDNALTLDNVIEFYSKPDRARMAVANVKAPTSGKQVIKKYEKVVGSLNCKTDFRRFGGLEKHCLPEEYKNGTPDAFMYSMVNYISTWAKNEDNTLNGLFLAQFSINLKNLVYDKFAREEDKQRFISAICKVIDLVG